MVLDQRRKTRCLERSEDLADYFRVLLDNGSEWDDVDDALLTVSERMAERKAQ